MWYLWNNFRKIKKKQKGLKQMIKQLLEKFQYSDTMINLKVYLTRPGNLLKTVKRVGLFIFIIIFFVFIFNMLGRIGF